MGGCLLATSYARVHVDLHADLSTTSAQIRPSLTVTTSEGSTSRSSHILTTPSAWIKSPSLSASSEPNTVLSVTLDVSEGRLSITSHEPQVRTSILHIESLYLLHVYAVPRHSGQA